MLEASPVASSPTLMRPAPMMMDSLPEVPPPPVVAKRESCGLKSKSPSPPFRILWGWKQAGKVVLFLYTS